ncbi:MAG: hypothetical protein AAFY71_21175 [Bacteroidota bacterium]
MKEVLRSIDDVSLWPVVAILIFFTFFTVLLIYVIRMKKEEVNTLASLPINDDGCETKTKLNQYLQNKSL